MRSNWRTLSRHLLVVSTTTIGWTARQPPDLSFTMPRPLPSAMATAATTPDAQLEPEILAALNRARTNPRGFAKEIESLLPDYHGKLLREPGWTASVQTVEGAPAAREAIAVLEAMRPLPPVQLSTGLTRAAHDHAVDQGRSGATGHVGTSGSTFTQRVERYGTWTGTINESIEYSAAAHGVDVVENLIIDDGVSDRGHRHNLFEPAATLAGIACGPHRVYGNVCVIELAGGFKEK